ncbi:hypothetical protein BJ980_001668 [Nocardioides daedukensis]|uniref:Uncharacterized protein n=1 Tax=Nocardioides daedukensis TaxID=634462 RepID=A0A7Y9S3F7_9ACTN|nr:hypothetical protein [Nocardioides daedukensis]NYG58745.1 hypothetical protein [Nocardioides daedukensis]
MSGVSWIVGGLRERDRRSGDRRVRASLIHLGALFAVLFGLACPGAAALDAPSSPAATTYSYDGHDYASPATDATSGRDPPEPSGQRMSACDAGACWSHGALARPDAGSVHPAIACDHGAELVPAARSASPTEEKPRVAEAHPVAFERAGVAAKAGARELPSSSEAARLIQGAKPTGSALKSDAWHRAAAFTTDDIAKNGTVFRTGGGDGVERLLVQMPGEVNGIAGRFEWIVDGGSLTHQMFVRGGTLNGIPIKP